MKSETEYTQGPDEHHCPKCNAKFVDAERGPFDDGLEEEPAYKSGYKKLVWCDCGFLGIQTYADPQFEVLEEQSRDEFLTWAEVLDMRGNFESYELDDLRALLEKDPGWPKIKEE